MASTRTHTSKGDPDAPLVLTKADHRAQATVDAIQSGAHEAARAAARVSPMPWETAERVAQLLSHPVPRTSLVVWRARLYCGHVAEWATNQDQTAPGLSHICPECGLATAVIAYRCLGTPDENWRARKTRLPRRSLPSTVRSAAAVLAEVKEGNERTRAQVRRAHGVPDGSSAPALEARYTTDPDQAYRWKVELECGCVRETLTNGDDPVALERQSHPCLASPDEHPALRRVTDWLDRSEACYTDQHDEKIYGGLRVSMPRDALRQHTALWTVVLECGHRLAEQPTRPDFDPALGPTYAAPERLAELRKRPIVAEDEGLRRWVDNGGPDPDLERQCHACRRDRPVVAYDPIGWLLPRRKTGSAKKTGAPKKEPSRAAMQRRLRDAERELARLRGLEQEIARLRQDLADTEENPDTTT